MVLNMKAWSTSVLDAKIVILKEVEQCGCDILSVDIELAFIRRTKDPRSLCTAVLLELLYRVQSRPYCTSYPLSRGLKVGKLWKCTL